MGWRMDGRMGLMLRCGNGAAEESQTLTPARNATRNVPSGRASALEAPLNLERGRAHSFFRQRVPSANVGAGKTGPDTGGAAYEHAL